ncbi:MAG: P1 family peptidase [Eubacteriales bacterium]
MYNSDFKIKDIKIGHFSDTENGTGTTVILAEKGATIGVSVRGAAPGTRETDLADPKNAVEKANAVMLTGGSAFGLDAASGIMQYLESKKSGYKTKEAFVPIVLGSVLYDLGYKSASVRPDADFGKQACFNAIENNTAQGSIGAGCGATCGKALGKKKATKTGLGIGSVSLGGGVYVTAIVAANPLGDIYDYKTNQMISGLTSPTTYDIFLQGLGAFMKAGKGENTTIGCIITNAKMTKAQANKLADISHDGIALAIRPCHTMYDGDTLFAMSTNKLPCLFDRVLVAGVEATATAIANAAYSAKDDK